MFSDGNSRPSPGLRAFLGRLLYGLLPQRVLQLVGAAWSYLMGPWEASSFLPSGWLIHRSVQSGELPEVLEALGLRQGSWEELGECLDELGPWKELLGPEVGLDLELLKSWKGVSSGKDVELALNDLSAWQRSMLHNNMQVFWEQGLTPWKDMVEVKQEEDDHECHKAASADQKLGDTSEPCKVAPESPSLGIISYILNVGTSGVEWKDDGTVGDTLDNHLEIQHIRNKRLSFLQQNKTLEGLASDAKQHVPDLPDTTGFSWSNHPVSNLSLNVSESQSQPPACAQCELVSDISLAQGDFLETIQKCPSCEQLSDVDEEADKSDHLQKDCPPSPDKDQGYHSLEYWQCPPLQRNLTSENIENTEPCEVIDQSVFSLPTGLTACPSDKNDGQSSEDMDFDLEQEVPAAPPVPICTNKHIGYILGTVVSEDEEDDDDDLSVSSSDKWDEVEDDDDGFDSEGSLSSTESDADVPEDVLWNSFCSADPYNLQNFTANLQTGVKPEENVLSPETGDEHQSDEESWCDSNPESDNDTDSDYSADEEENLKLWNAFSKSDDPYNPLYFKAPVQTTNKNRQTGDTGSTLSTVVCRTLPNHEVTLVTCQAYDHQQLQLKEACNVHLEDSAKRGCKKVTFNDKVTIHYVCNEEERKGHWEELARDHCRFQRRIKETEIVIGHCLTPDHRQRAWERMHRHWHS